MRSAPAVSRALSAAMVLAFPAVAAAQATPKFEYGKFEDVKTVEWKAQAKGGFLMTGGNSQTTGGTLSASAARKEGNNKLALDAGLAYGKSRILTAVPNATDPLIIDGVTRTPVTTTNNWFGKGRYDRFFTTNNSGYVSAQGGGDKIAGKTFYGGGQIGYSRQLLKSDLHLLVAEIGYDLSYERYVQQPGKMLDPVTIHSARAFVGETLTLSPTTGVTASVEALFNLNKEGSAISVDNRMPGVDAFKDTRVLGKLGFTSTLWKSLSLGLGFTVKYDQNPAPLPLPPGTPMGVAYGPNFPFAETVDTLAEATLIYTFL